MPFQEAKSSHHNIDDFAREKFYELTKKHIDALNPKFCNKVVITRDQSEKIINILQNKLSTEKVFGHFPRWCKQTFTPRLIGNHQLLCDFKEVKPVLLYQDMYDIYQTSHHQTAHCGRDKCLGYIAVNYSWTNRSLLQIFIAQCSACQTRRTVYLYYINITKSFLQTPQTLARIGYNTY
ncbi:unnamed protein product [Rotaria sp. Silwood2]|nr:unnamed protein product [Rotaria sp. Silwood2]CAF2947509.1 unnamed protein product [Rotaria sp. Silwood2]CAF4363469.1 unnamed protein product [Rotaria sp. Silwood2]CAF4430549.1 unnamed protein product [Rotaria sp. Silwood2]